MRKRVICLCLSMMIWLTACGGQFTAQMQENIDNTPELITKTSAMTVLSEELSPTIPESTVKVLVNRKGYQPDRSKKALFIGENGGNTFYVVNKDTWEVVYTGEIEEAVLDGESELYVCQGDFSQVTESGTYFIETENIGRSYDFSIADDVNKSIFQDLLCIKDKVAYQESAQEIVNTSFGIHTLLLAIQCHGASFEKEKDNDLVTQLLQIAEWLENCQDSKTGSLYEDYAATAAFCGIMAMCADNFGKYDAVISKEYMAAALKAWKWMERCDTETLQKYENARFYAAAQLFAIEGGFTYQKIVTEYLEKNIQQVSNDMFSFLGAIIYLDTEKNTDRNLCTAVMQGLVNETEKICAKEKASPCLVYTEDLSKNLPKVLLICFVDYVTPSDEYAVIMENQLHYIMGRNETGSIYLDENGEWVPCDKTTDWNFMWNSILLFCLSDLLDEE